MITEVIEDTTRPAHRPEHEPTPLSRDTVKAMAQRGLPQTDIAIRIGISAPTLRKHYRQELDEGAADANDQVLATLFHLATSGKCPAATIFWAKTRCGYRVNGQTTFETERRSMSENPEETAPPAEVKPPAASPSPAFPNATPAPSGTPKYDPLLEAMKRKFNDAARE